MFSVFAPSPSWTDRDGDGRLWRGYRRRTGGSAVVTAILVAVVVALSCGICGVIGILYRRGHRHRCEDDVDPNCDHRGDGCGDGNGGGDVVGNGIGVGAGGKMVGGQSLPQPQKLGHLRTVVVAAAAATTEQRQVTAEYAIPVDEIDDDDCNRTETLVPLLRQQQQQQQQQQLRQCRQNAGDEHKAPWSSDRLDDGCGGPDIIMSTAAADTDKPTGVNWQPQQKRQAQQTKFNGPAGGSHSWSSHRHHQRQQRQTNATIYHPRPAAVTTTVTAGTLPATTTTATVMVLTDKYNCAKTKTIIDGPLSVSSRELLNSLHRESCI